MTETGDALRLNTKSRTIVLVVIAAYVLLLVSLAATGRFTFVTKTAVVPVVLLVAFATGHWRAFLTQWAVFLSVLVLFDAFRGYIYYATVTLDLDAYMNYVIEWERALLGGHVGPVAVQASLWNPAQTTALDKLLTVVHGSHFLFFLLFALAVWTLRREAFADLKLGMLLVMGGGLLGYALVPTIPPWMAARDFEVLPTITRVYGHVYNTATPELRHALDTNPIAAMPSLHTAFPAFLMFVAFRLWGWRAVPIVPYFGLMMFSLVYGGEHYVADEVAGVVLAGGVYLVVYRGRLRERVHARLVSQPASESVVLRVLDTELKRSAAATAVILLFAEVLGQITLSGSGTWQPNRAFVDRELVGKSPLAHVFLGRIAFADEDFATAQGEFEQALVDVDDEHRPMLSIYLAQAAWRNRDYAKTAAVLSTLPLESLEPSDARLLASAYVATGQPAQGLAVLNRLCRGYPGSAQLAYERALLGQQSGLLDATAIDQAIEDLRARFHDPTAARLAERLAATRNND